jgi:hypothetical protein
LVIAAAKSFIYDLIINSASKPKPLKLFPSNKKFKVIIYYNGVKRKTIHFGDSRYNDFISYYKSNPNFANDRKQLYLERHKNDDYNNFFTADLIVLLFVAEI